jgi:hypothetical protein
MGTTGNVDGAPPPRAKPLGTNEARSMAQIVGLDLSEERIATLGRQLESHMVLMRTVDGLRPGDAEPALELHLRPGKEQIHD